MNQFELGENIRKRRKYLGKNQEEIARKTAVSKSQISKWENENAYPSMTDFEKLSQALNIHPADLIEGRIEEDFIRGKEKKETIAVWAIVVLSVLTACLVVNIFVSLYQMKYLGESVNYQFEKNQIYCKDAGAGIWEIRQLVRSSDGVVWVDLVTYQQNGIIADYELKEVVFTGDETERERQFRLIDGGKSLEIYIMYQIENHKDMSFIQVTPDKIR